MRDPGNVANIDSLLDTVTALVADCDHDNVKRIKTIEAYTSRCKLLVIRMKVVLLLYSKQMHNSQLCLLIPFQTEPWPRTSGICDCDPKILV